VRVSRRGKASRLTPTPGGDDQDTKGHHLVPDLADPADGRVAFRGRCPRLRVAATLLSCMVAATACGGSGGSAHGAPPAAPATSAVTAPSSSAPHVPSSLPPPPSVPPPPAPPDCAATQLAVMPARARAGQLFLLGVPANALPGVEQQITADGPAGVFLTGHTTVGTAALARHTAELQRVATAASGGSGLFLATDQEGGQVQVLSGPGFSDIPPATVQGTWTPGRLQAAATGWGHELRAGGINVDLAPVADVVSPALGTANAPIGQYGRAFGTDPQTVSEHVAAFVRGMHAAGVISTVKHFPGLGRVRGNTDYSTGVTDPQTTPTDPNLQTFTDGVTAGAAWLMVSTADYPAIDPSGPAVFSPTVLNLARQRVGPEGLIVSDDLGHAAQVASVPPGARAVGFIKAGGDLVLTANPTTLPTMIDALLDAAHDPTFAAQLNAAELRVTQAKAAAGLLPCQTPGR